MANPQHFSLLSSHLEAWNQWRKQNPEIIPDLQGANLSNHNLRGANLSNANLERAIFYGADLSCALLTKANLRHSDFTSAICLEGIFNEADFSYAYLTQADFSQALLCQANLQRVYLIEAYLVNANLQNANLEKADLSNAYLTGANLTGVNLEDTNFSGADLTGAKGLQSTHEDSSFIDVSSSNVLIDYLPQKSEKTLNKLAQKRKIMNIISKSNLENSDKNCQKMAKEIERLDLENIKLKVQLYELYDERSQLINEIHQLKKTKQNIEITNIF